MRQAGGTKGGIPDVGSLHPDAGRRGDNFSYRGPVEVTPLPAPLQSEPV